MNTELWIARVSDTTPVGRYFDQITNINGAPFQRSRNRGLDAGDFLRDGLVVEYPVRTATAGFIGTDSVVPRPSSPSISLVALPTTGLSNLSRTHG